ncbi:MAG: 4Fe-4S binding protein [Pelolinea sp.]|nr:4Fe-4S binding protein [Pelolinea sp.]
MADQYLPVIEVEKCILCGLCVETCPEDVLALEADELAFANPDQCTMCAECEGICPEGAVACYYQISWAENEEQL